MENLEQLSRELARSGKKDALEKLAASEDGRRLGGMIDPKAAENALKTGDRAALQRMLSSVLSTEEGKRLAAGVRELMKK